MFCKKLIWQSVYIVELRVCEKATIVGFSHHRLRVLQPIVHFTELYFVQVVLVFQIFYFYVSIKAFYFHNMLLWISLYIFKIHFILIGYTQRDRK